MAKTKISEFSSTASNNTDIDGISIAEGMAPSNVNNAIRELMSQLKDWQSGAVSQDMSVNGVLTVSGNTVLSANLTATGTATISGVTNLTASPATSSGTYGRAGTTITVSSSSHGFSNGQVLYLFFSAGTGGTATSSAYTISNVSTNTFDVTDTVSGSISGSPSVTITRGGFTCNGAVVNTSLSVGGPMNAAGAASLGSSLSVAGNATISGNATICSTTVTSGTYGRSATTVTVNSSSHGFSNGQVLYLVFSAGTGGTATSGVYTISNVSTNSFEITDQVSGTISGSPSVSITKYNNVATLQAPLSFLGSVGTSGYILASSGANAPPQWVSGISTLTNGTTKLSVDSNGNFTSVLSSGTTLYPAYLNRAWVNFNPTTTSTDVVSYTQNNGSGGTGTIITVSYAGHGLSAGQALYMNFTSGTSVDGWYTVTSVTDANTIVLTGATNLNTSGAASIYKAKTFAGGNIASIFCSTGASSLFNQYALNFTTEFTDTSYCWSGSVGYDSQNQNAFVSSPGSTALSTWKNTKYLRFGAFYANQGLATSTPADISVTITR
jgi:hypothetical protein